MTIQTIGQINNPVTGVFGTGNVQFFPSSGTWTVPQGIGKVRVRVWGAGGGYSSNTSNYGGGGGGGFALKTIYDLTGVTSVSVVVGTSVTNSNSATLLYGGTSSFGSYVSATGGAYCGASSTANVGGTGIGGDINTSGGYGSYYSTTAGGGGGGCGSIFGNGGNAATGTPPASSGGAGGGSGQTSAGSNAIGGMGFLTAGAMFNNSTTFILTPAQAINVAGPFSIDFIGTGGGGCYQLQSANGGGGGYGGPGGAFPGGGNGYASASSGSGLVIVEW